MQLPFLFPWRGEPEVQGDRASQKMKGATDPGGPNGQSFHLPTASQRISLARPEALARLFRVLWIPPPPLQGSDRVDGGIVIGFTRRRQVALYLDVMSSNSCGKARFGIVILRLGRVVFSV